MGSRLNTGARRVVCNVWTDEARDAALEARRAHMNIKGVAGAEPYRSSKARGIAQVALGAKSEAMEEAGLVGHLPTFGDAGAAATLKATTPDEPGAHVSLKGLRPALAPKESPITRFRDSMLKAFKKTGHWMNHHVTTEALAIAAGEGMLELGKYGAEHEATGHALKAAGHSIGSAFGLLSATPTGCRDVAVNIRQDSAPVLNFVRQSNGQFFIISERGEVLAGPYDKRAAAIERRDTL